MRTTILTTVAMLALVGTAHAGGFSVNTSMELGASGSALSKGGTSGGTYAKGQNGSNASAFSENFITNTGKVSVCGACEAFDTRTSEGFGRSEVSTNGPGSLAEAYSERNTFGKSKVGFHAQLEKSVEFNGSGQFPGTGWGVGGVPGSEFGQFPGGQE